MKEWFAQLEQRERNSLIAGGCVLIIVFAWFLGWEPLNQSVTQLEKRNQEQRELLAWMQKTAAEVKQLQRSSGGPRTLPAGQSLLALVDRTTKSGKLAGTVKRIQPKGKNGVQLRLEKVPFDDVVVWLNSLKTRYGIVASNASFERGESPGRINARISLEASGG